MQSDALSHNLSLSQPKVGAERQNKGRLRITLVGLGRIGTSIGLALHQGGSFEIVGHDKEHQAVQAARKAGAIDRSEWNLINAIDNADMVVLAIPLAEIEPTFKAMGPHLKAGCLVTDTATLKTPVVGWAKQYLPDEVSYVGGNPILPASGDSQATASATLFKDGIWCVCPIANTDESSLMALSNFVTRMGANPLYLEPVEHDGLISGVEHLPTVLAAALLTTLGRGSGWREMRKLAGTQFDSSTQIHNSDLASLSQAVANNRENLLHWLDSMIATLSEWRAALQEESAAPVQKRFAAALETRGRWYADRVRGEWEEKIEQPDIPTAGDNIKGLFGLRKRPNNGKKDSKDPLDSRPR